MRASIGAFLLTAVAVTVAALLVVTSSGGGNGTATQPTSQRPSTSRSSERSVTPSSEGGREAVAEAKKARLGPLESSHIQHINLEIRTTETLDEEEQPRYVPLGATAATLKNWKGHFTVKKGQTVIMTIINEDDGSAPLAPGYHQFDEVQGGTETVEGLPVTSVPNENVAHTFSVLGLGVNAAIPAAPKGGTDKIVLTFTPTKTGTFPWQCFAPCGSWGNGFGAAMDTPGWMQGTITVIS